MPETRHREREHRPQQVRMVRHADHDERADKEAHRRPADGAEGGGAGAQRIGPQHRQGAQNHPETVLDVGDLDHQRRQGPAPSRPAAHCGTTPTGTRGGGGADARRRGEADSSVIAVRRSTTGPLPGRLERGVGDHLGGDAEGAGMEPRVELAHQALVLVRLSVGGTGCRLSGVRRRRCQ